MNGYNFTSAKSISLVSVLVLSIISVGFLLPQVIADHGEDPGITKTLDAGISTIVSFRDTANVLLQSVTLSVDTSTTNAGFFTVIVQEEDSNLDSSAIDVIFSSATSTSSVLDQAITMMFEIDPDTGVLDPDTGFFSGTIQVSSSPTEGNNLELGPNDDIFVTYNSESLGVSRFSAVIDSSSAGSVKVTDVLINLADFAANNVLRPVTHPVSLEFSGGTLVTDIESVTFSCINPVFRPLDNPSGLKIFFSVPPFGFISVSDGVIGPFQFNAPLTIVDSDNPTQCTISADLTNSNFDTLLDLIALDPAFEGQPITEILFTTAFDKAGLGGGGGGGLVRAGLVVNALAGTSALTGGGGGGPPGPTLTLGALSLYDSAVEIISMPQEIRDIALDHDPHTPLEPIFDPYEDFDLPLSINGNGFVLGDYENTLETQTIEPGKPTEFVLVYYTNSELAHSSLNFNLGPTRTIAGSDTQVLLYKDKFEIIDPNGNILSATGSINNEGDLKRVATFSITFSEDIQWSNSDLVIRSWNDNFNSGDIIVYDAIKVLPSEVEIAFEQSLPEPEVEQLKSQYVPIWIKNNAAWWSQQLIEDSDFVAGIEYLIQQEIITLTDTGTLETNSSDEIPEWIKNNAGWWSEDLITEKEFIDGLQWLISNGIIQVTET